MNARDLVGKLVMLKHQHASWSGLVVQADIDNDGDGFYVLIYRCESPHRLMRWYDLDMLSVLD